MSGRRLAESLPKLSLDRRITVLVLVLTLAVLGVVSIYTIPIELIPRGYSEPFLRVTAAWRDAPPQEVLDKITLPLEEELATVRGLDRMFSFARPGYTQVWLSFKQGTDMDVAYREVRDRIERARGRTPEDLEQIFIRKDDDTSIPVSMIGLAVDPDTTEIYDLIQNEVVLPLERIAGVARVEVNGLEEKEILIELDRERVEGAGLDVYNLAQGLARDNFSLASGSVRAGAKKLLLRSQARYTSAGSVAGVMVADGVRLGDVATVRYDEPEKEYAVRVNGRPAYALAVMKEGEANTIEVAKAVDDQVRALGQNPRLQGFEIDVFMSQGEVIEDSLSVLLSSGRIGAVFALVVLFFFLRRLRMSLIIALSIPLSMVVALVVMYFAGESLNLLSLLGLMISVGLLVDNSVVVAENIHRLHRQGGVSRRQATLAGTSEIALAITTATLTTVVVFLPVSLVEGQGQFFLLRLAIPISVSLAASLFVALVLVPLGVYLTLPRERAGGEPDAEPWWEPVRRQRDAVLAGLYDASFGALNRLYSRILAVSLERRLELVLILAGVIALTQWGARDRLDIVPMSDEERGFFEIGVEMPNSSSFEETEAWFGRAEAVMAELNENELGLEFYVLFHQRRWGEIQGAVPSSDDAKLSPRAMMDRILEELPELPGIRFHTGQDSESDKEDQLARETVTLYGEDAEQLGDLALELEERFIRVPGVLGARRASEPLPNELALVLDRDRLQRQGLSPTTVAGVVSYALRGQSLPRIYFGGRDIPVRVRFEEADRESLSELGAFAVPSPEGGTLPLASLVDVRPLRTSTQIFRRDKQIARRITLELEEGREKEARSAIRALKGRVDLPEGVSFGGPRRDPVDDEVRNLQYALLLSIGCVYLLIGFLFESFLLPLAILVTMPLAQLGVIWIHLLARRPMDFLGLVGLIILIGVVVNNGIVLLDYVNRLRAAGESRKRAILLASERRFRPIMMTALTTICGMVPLVFGGVTRMGISYKSFGLTLIGGMVTASLLTLLVVPVAYTLLEDGRRAVERTIGVALAVGKGSKRAEA